MQVPEIAKYVTLVGALVVVAKFGYDVLKNRYARLSEDLTIIRESLDDAEKLEAKTVSSLGVLYNEVLIDRLYGVPVTFRDHKAFHEYYGYGFATKADIRVAFFKSRFEEGKMTFRPSSLFPYYRIGIITIIATIFLIAAVFGLFVIYADLKDGPTQHWDWYAAILMPLGLSVAITYQNREVFIAHKLWKREQEFFTQQKEIVASDETAI